jgi:hypothetical protein
MTNGDFSTARMGAARIGRVLVAISVLGFVLSSCRSDPDRTGHTAEAFVRIAGTRTSSGGPQEVDVSGYHCVRTRTEEDPLPVSFYECTNGPKKVTFVRS